MKRLLILVALLLSPLPFFAQSQECTAKWDGSKWNYEPTGCTYPKNYKDSMILSVKNMTESDVLAVIKEFKPGILTPPVVTDPVSLVPALVYSVSTPVPPNTQYPDGAFKFTVTTTKTGGILPPVINQTVMLKK